MIFFFFFLGGGEGWRGEFRFYGSIGSTGCLGENFIGFVWLARKLEKKILTFLWNVWVSRNIIVVSRESANFDVLRDRESGTSHESWFILIHKQDPFVDFCCLGLYYCQWALLAQMALSPPTSLDGGWVWGYKTHLVNF